MYAYNEKWDGVMQDTGTTVSSIAPSLMVARSPGGSQQWQYSQRMIS